MSRIEGNFIVTNVFFPTENASRLLMSPELHVANDEKRQLELWRVKMCFKWWTIFSYRMIYCEKQIMFEVFRVRKTQSWISFSAAACFCIPSDLLAMISYLYFISAPKYCFIVLSLWDFIIKLLSDHGSALSEELK